VSHLPWSKRHFCCWRHNICRKNSFKKLFLQKDAKVTVVCVHPSGSGLALILRVRAKLSRDCFHFSSNPSLRPAICVRITCYCSTCLENNFCKRKSIAVFLYVICDRWWRLNANEAGNIHIIRYIRYYCSCSRTNATKLQQVKMSDHCRHKMRSSA